MFGLVLMMPVIELFIFGYVVATDIDDIDLAVCDYSQTAESRAYVEQLDAQRLLPHRARRAASIARRRPPARPRRGQASRW